MREKSTWAASMRLTMLVFALISVLAVPIGFSSGLFRWSPTTEGILRTTSVALIAPAIFEEVAFRGPLLLLPTSHWRFWGILGSTILFVAWHIVEATTFLSAANPLFFQADFLAIAALLGAGLAWLTLRTRRLSPAIFLHWIFVVAWKQLLGGPTLLGGSL